MEIHCFETRCQQTPALCVPLLGGPTSTSNSGLTSLFFVGQKTWLSSQYNLLVLKRATEFSLLPPYASV